MNFFVSYLFYPLLLSATLGLYAASLFMGWSPSTVFLWLAIGRFAMLFAVEFLHPARPEWRMNWPNFKRDLKYSGQRWHSVVGQTGDRLAGAGLEPVQHRNRDRCTGPRGVPRIAAGL